MEIIKIEDLTFWYPEEEKSSLDNINLTIKEGEFVLIIGPSGCGKSTLVRCLNRVVPDFYGGKVQGKVLYKNKNLRYLDNKDIVSNIGMVYQHPEKMLILQDVEREIAFGLENLNFDYLKMRRNTAEVLSLLGLNDKRKKATQKLSGGEKQRVAIASVMAMDPEIIIFDEPTSQLDPISSEEVMNSITRINKEYGKTTILVEQRLDKCFEITDRVIFMDKGKIIQEGTPKEIARKINNKYFLPRVTYLFKEASYEEYPLNIKEARNLMLTEARNDYLDKIQNQMNNEDTKKANKLLEVQKLKFEYKKGDETLKNINFSINKGEIMVVMGENGAGKSTLFKIITGLIDNYKGNIKINGKDIKKFKMNERIKLIGYLSQNPNDYFGRKNVFEEVGYTLKNLGEYSSERVEETLEMLNITHLKDRNPRDLSGGEKQRVAIACTLVTNPEILILDEPTRGMDVESKENLGNIIKNLTKQGKSIILITHDSDFSGDYADSAMLMFDGEIIAIGDSKDVLSESIYYSPQVSKVFRNKCKVINSNEGINILKRMNS